MTLFENLESIAHLVERNLPKMKNNEDATINVSVSPFIRALGYNTQDLDEVYPQYPILNTDAVDYAILRDDAPVMFVEAKSASNKLQNKEWKQLFQYFNAEIGLRFGILTNGVEYRFYTDLKADNIMDKEPFLTLDLLNLDERLVAELEGFTKSSFDPGRIKAGAKKQVILRLLQREMDRPSDALVKHFARQVHSGRLSERDIPRYASFVKDAWQNLVDQMNARHSQTKSDFDTTKGKTTPVRNKIKPFDPTKQGVSRKNNQIPVYADWHGHSFEAKLVFDESHHRSSRVTFDGLTATPSNTALKAIRTVKPDFKAINGWDFWRLRDPNGNQERRIGDLRSDDALVRRLRGQT